MDQATLIAATGSRFSTYGICPRPSRAFLEVPARRLVACGHHLVSVRCALHCCSLEWVRNSAIRPDIGNPNAPLNTRAIVFPELSNRVSQPGHGCVRHSGRRPLDPEPGLPNANTVGRNTLVTGGINNFDVSLSKSFQIAEQKRLEFRWEALNALNHPQFTQVPDRDVNSSDRPAAF